MMMKFRITCFLVCTLLNLNWLVANSCDTIGTTYVKNSKLAPVKIGGYVYTSYTGVEFSSFDAIPEASSKINKYPFQQTNPQINLSGNPGLYAVSDAKDIDRLMSEILADVDVKIKVKKAFLIINDVGTCDYIYVLYNEEETVLFAKFTKVPKDHYFNIGKDLYINMVYQKLAQVNNLNNTFVYQVSETVPKPVGCISTEQTNGEPDRLEMNKYRFSKFGTENMWFRGPCSLNETSQAIQTIKVEHSTLPNINHMIFIKYDNETSKFITRYSPLFWYTGQYKVSMELNEKIYKATFDVYTPTEYGIDIYDQDKIDSTTEFIIKIWLNIKAPNVTTNLKMLFRIPVFEDTNTFPRPYETIKSIYAKGVTCYGYSNKCFIVSSQIINDYFYFPPGKIMGYFDAYIGGVWYKSKIFNILGLLLNPSTDFTRDFMSGAVCQNYLSTMPVLNDLSCPVTLNKVKTTTSKFEPVQTLFQDLDCYKGYLNGSTKSGITCCYNTSSDLLITGAANFAGKTNLDKKLEGSYRWKYLPTEQPNLHYLFDRLPLVSCCSNFDKYSTRSNKEKNYLCNKYWYKYHNISAVNNPIDYTGDLFGDPHVIGFSSSDIRYTYLYHGFYTLLDIENKVNMIGLFYAGSTDYKTVLQYLLIKLDNNQVMEIVPIHNKAGTLTWTILIAKSEVKSLPYYNKNFMISQSADKTVLSIQTNNGQEFSLKMVLTKFPLFNLPFTFMNLKVFVQVPDKKSKLKLEGLFGTVDIQTGQISFLPRHNTTNGDIVKTWRMDNADLKDITFFNENETKVLNDPITVKPFNIKANPLCKGDKFCNVDITAYPKMKIYESTLATVDARSKYSILEKNAAIIPEMCPYPSFNDWIIQPNDRSLGSISPVIGCYNPVDKFIQSEVVYINCTKPPQTNGIPFWKVSISDWSRVCVSPMVSTVPPPRTTTSPPFDPLAFYIVGGIVGALLLMAALSALYLFVYRRRQKTREIFEMSVSN